METRLYQLNKSFATHNGLLVYFSAIPLYETEKAVYLYGHGTTETTKMGLCCCCGAALTHPVSVLLGIGPICGGHWWDWKAVGGYTLENIEKLKSAITEKVFDGWVPKSQIVQNLPTVDIVQIPTEHPIWLRSHPKETPNSPVINGNMKSDVSNSPKRYAELIEGSANYALQVIKIVFPFDKEDIDRVKSLHERRYIPEGKYWVCKYQLENIEKLKQWGFTLATSLETILKRSVVSVKDVKEVHVPGLKMELFPFQKKGVAFIEAKNGRALVADEMGLGKTVQALAWLQLHPELRKAIIVVPASLKLNWLKEAKTWMTNPDCEVVSGTKPYKIRGQIIIINYDILAYWVEYLSSVGFKVLIMDEVHCIKNSTTKRTKAVKKLAKGIHHIIGLSGTPIINRPVEMYNALTLIDSSVIPNFKEYTKRYCGATYNGFGWDFTGATNTDELHKKLTDTIMIRRKKTDVLTDLPDKLKSFVPIELANQDEYETAESNFMDFLKETKGLDAAARASQAEALVEIEGLKQLALAGKLDACIDWIEDFLETDQKLVVFAVHKEAIDTLMGKFGKIAVKVDGSVSMVQRNESVIKFQTDPKIKLFVGNIQAAGVGLTLTEASNVAFIELPWTPGALVQAEDRCHRIGQKDSVTIHYLLAAGTIEEKIAKLLDAKRKVLDAVLDGEKTAQTSLLAELMKEYL